MGMLEDRKSNRFDFNVEVIIDEQVFTNCVDISETGLYINTVKPFKKDSTVELTIPAYGLSIKALVKHHEKGIGVGLEFKPENDGHAQEVHAIIESLKLSGQTRPEKMTVLMIDSVGMLRSVYKNRLVLDGFSVAEVKDGMEAIKKMNAFKVHAVITELEVKRIKLQELIPMIREAPDYKTIPLYVIGNPTSFDVESWVVEAGADRYMAKSTTTASELSKLVSRVLHKNKQ